MIRALRLAALVALLSTPALAGPVAGPARLIDGDTIEIGGETIRLHGIDAPETGQSCRDHAGRAYACGEEAVAELRRLIGNGPVTCAGDQRDRYGRLIATCHAGGENLNRAMVRAGWAVAFRKYSEDYVAEELDAAKAARGLWQGPFDRPGEVRARDWQAAKADRPDGCVIKGNISSSGRIYHMPWSRHYARTRINEARGERWFCTEAEAKAAGWRPARR